MVVAGWRAELARRVDAVGAMARGRFVAEPGGERVSGERLLEPGILSAAVGRARPAGGASGDPKDLDPRIALSRMSRAYCASLTCVALVGLANGVGVDLSPGRCTVTFHDDLPSRLWLEDEARPVRWEGRPVAWAVGGPVVATVEQLREYVWTNLYARNLRRLFDIAVGMVNVPARLLWSNAAEWVGVVMDSAIGNLEPDRAEPIVAECRAVLTAETLPGFGGEPNPLRGLVEWKPFDGGEGIQTRHLCCLVYQHTDRHGRLCWNCPLLPLPQRAALGRERLGTKGSTAP